jgi:hypothetical protein
MPLQKIPYNKLEPLIKKYLDTEENDATNRLIVELRSAKRRGYLLKPELVKICRWKSPRALQLIMSNSETSVNKFTREAFATRSEKRKIELLTRLNGVSVPMASSILTLLNPKRYGVIDIRVWELLYTMGIMTSNSKAVNFKFSEWYEYLVIIRHFANELNLKARDIERTLFNVHQEYQQGNLYDKSKKKKVL